MFTFYFDGHYFEYEVRNALRVFDLNVDYEIKDREDLIYNKGLGLLSVLEYKNDELTAYAFFYEDDKLQYESYISSSQIVLETDNPKKLRKTLVVKAIHNILKNYYKFKPDYGILTGVRPVKILFAAKNFGRSDEEINEIFRETYEVSEDRIKLLWEVSKIEEKYIDEEKRIKNYNLYVGIPFCPSKCSYCSFTSFVNFNNKIIENYLEILIYEIEETLKLALEKKLHLNTIYIGGGTPSVLDEEQINKIFNIIKKYYDLSSIKEITFEAGRPDTITDTKLLCLKNNYVNRISINPQTMNLSTLNTIGRKHDTEDIVDKYILARKLGFEIINMDIILGLPGEEKIHVENTIKELLKLKPDNITVHALAYKRNSTLTKESVKLSKEYEKLKSMQLIVEEKCLEVGYKPYYMYRQKNIKGNLENVGYTINNKESIYNIVIIEESETILACGAGSTSKIMFENNRHESIHNFKSLEEYSRRIDEILQKKKELLDEHGH